MQYLQVPCQIFIGTDGGLKHHNGSFSWLIYSPAREKLVLNSGPVDGWHKCQSSLRSEATALASVTFYLEEVAVFFDLTIQCQFRLYVDSSSAISNVNQLRDLIPKRQYANNADVLSTMRSAHHVIEKFSIQHVKSHQDNSVEFDKLPFPTQVNVTCDHMATAQLKRQSLHADERTQSVAPTHEPFPLQYFLVIKILPRTTLPVSARKSPLIATEHFFKPNMAGPVPSGSQLLGTPSISVLSAHASSTLRTDRSWCITGLILAISAQRWPRPPLIKLACVHIAPSQKTLSINCHVKLRVP